jgi:GDP-L-fucose synthase
MNKKILKTKIYVAGHNGMVGSACVRLLKDKGYLNLIVSSSKDLDLTNQQEVKIFLKKKSQRLLLMQLLK